MTPAQQVAIQVPCYVAEDCANPRYRCDDRYGAVVLTVNSGFE